MKKLYTPNFQRRFIGKSALTCFLFLVFTFNSSAQPDITGLQTKLNQTIDSLYTASKVPGIAVAIWTPNLAYKYVIGKADLKTSVERKFDDKIRIGSITKTFVATVILQLVDESKIGLDDKLDIYYPDYPNSENITIRQMLDMTSGIPDYIENPEVLKSFLYDRLDKYTPAQLYDITKSMTPTFAPGTGWNYSNGNYNILGMMIEKVTRNKIENEIIKRVLVPLGLINTSYPLLPEMTGQYNHGYMRDTLAKEFVDVTVMDPSITWAAGCMISNIDDLKIYGDALAKGNLLSPEIQEERLKWVSTGVIGFVKYGLGIFNLGGFIGHNGGITGYNTTMGYNPELDALIITSVNEYGVNGGISDHVFTTVAKIVFPDKNLFK